MQSQPRVVWGLASNVRHRISSLSITWERIPNRILATTKTYYTGLSTRSQVIYMHLIIHSQLR